MFLRRTADWPRATCGRCGWSQSVSPEFTEDLAAALRNHQCHPDRPVTRQQVTELRDSLTQWLDATEED